MAFAVLLALLSGCAPAPNPAPRGAKPDTAFSRPDSSGSPAPAPRDTLPIAAAPDTTVHAGRYRTERIADRAAFRRFYRRLGPERFLLALKVNRRDSLHVRDGEILLVPDSTAELLDLSPFPREAPSARDLAKLILVSRRVQAFAAYDSGRLARWGPVSTGRETLQTPEGLYHTNWKDAERTSTFNEEWLLKWYINLENFLGISFHLFDLPGYAASHSCVRLMLDDAMWLYDWVEQWRVDPLDRRKILVPGTPVVVFGEFRYGHKSPWRDLAKDSTATDVPHTEIEAALERYLRSGQPGPIDSLRVATLQAMREATKARADSAALPR